MKIYFNFLYKYLFRFKKKLIIILLITLVQSAIVICIPLTTSGIIDWGIGKNNKKILLSLSILMLALYIGNSLITILNNYYMATIGEKIGYLLREELNLKVCRLEYSFFMRNTASSIINSFNKEIETIKKNVSYMLLRVFSNIISVLISLSMIFLINWKIGVITLCTSVLYALSIKGWGKVISPLAEKSFFYNERILNSLINTYKNVLIIKLNNATEYIKKSFDSIYQMLFSNEVKLETAYSANINLGMLLMSSTTVLVWGLGGMKVIDGNLSTGIIMAVIGYQNMLVNPINFICDFTNSYQSTAKAIQNLNRIMTSDEESEGGECFFDCINNIRFKNVSYKYNDVWLLNSINMSFDKGNIYAIVGESGIGKSTITKIMVKLLMPNAGQIFVDNVELKELNLYSLRSNIGYVMQESLFFCGTIMENIFLDNDIDYEKLQEYSCGLRIYEEIENFPNKWNTILSEDTQNISGGQKKRIDILRNMLKNVSVLIFDESFSAIDFDRRNAIYNFLEKVKKNYIILIISHDDRDLKYCDVVYKIKNKKIESY